MLESREVRFMCANVGDDDCSVTFEFDAYEMSEQEMFMMWVRFMNAIGYVLDAVEMEEMWSMSK